MFPYPPGRWRLASLEQLELATLWVGHIAIRHESSTSESLRAPGWQPDGPPPKRSLAAALALTNELRDRLASAPNDFEKLARQYSEDPLTRELGGYLGGLRASQLAPTDFLDVLATLKPGQISQPFQTPYGVHLLKRYPAPAQGLVAGERIVIGYEGVFGLGREVARTRAEALALAQDVASRAKRDPARFRALVAQYSDNVDRVIHGDIGTYSTHDPGYLPLEVDGLSRVKIGETFGPLESRQGFEILRRVPLGPHKEYAMTAVEVRLDVGLRSEDAALRQAGVEATKLREILARDPARFQELQRLKRSEGVRRWAYPQGDLTLMRELDTLVPGEINAEAVRYGNALLIVKRLDPTELPPAPPRLPELPSPSDPDYDALIGYNDGKQLAAAARAFLGELRGTEGARLGPRALDVIAKVFLDLSSQLEQSHADSVAARTKIHSALASLERELGAGDYGTFTAVGRRWVINQMMPEATGANMKPD